MPTSKNLPKFQVASTDLMSMGIRVISYTINEVTDDQGYLKALGKPRTAEVKRDADIGNAEAKRDAGIEVILQVFFAYDLMVFDSSEKHVHILAHLRFHVSLNNLVTLRNAA